jgi:RHS repeat-associated protein
VVSSNGNSTAQKFKTYQEQEWHNELGLNLHQWKYRMSDPALGRFISIDPLAEDFYYNSTYAFQENKLGLGRELEGAELIPHSWLVNDAVKNPNGIGAHTIGISQGLVNTVTGVVDAISNPVQTLQGMGNMLVAGVAQANPGSMMAIDNALGTDSLGAATAMAQSIDGAINDVTSGNGIERGTVVGEVIGAIAGSKGVNATVKGVSTAIKANSTTKVFRAFGGDAKAGGFSWTPIDPKSVGNFRDAAGLPSGGASGSINTAENIIQGTVKNKNIIKKRAALPLDGNKGGLPEYIIDPKNVDNKTTRPMN